MAENIMTDKWVKAVDGSIVCPSDSVSYDSPEDIARAAGWRRGEDRNNNYRVMILSAGELIFVDSWEEACELTADVKGEDSIKEVAAGTWMFVANKIYSSWQAYAEERSDEQ